MMWYDGGWGWGGWFVMTVSMVLFWAVLIAGLIALVRHLAGTRRHQQPGPPPPPGGGGWQGWGAENVLAERFARGEIDEEEYKRRLALLREHR
ncbi:SHOCT domain-containing protein [Streptomyces sp. NPDC014684]|uniref:SHOCT domain-containing protein n=1 Tax=unclassified Streptomyces TaxID=2593676 RepID=UPI003405AE87